MAVQTQIQTRRGTAASWTSTNPTLAAGEIGFESDTNKFKIGTGSTAWASLAYASNVSPLTTKGDLYTYSTDNTRLAVGANGETIVADSSTSTGLRYQGTMAAGKNAAINGGMDIWQRGTSFAIASGANTAYQADRWQTTRYATGSTVSRQLTGDTTNLPFVQYCSRVQRDSGNTSTAIISMNQAFESVNSIPFAGQTVVLSFYARKGANYSGSSDILNAAVRTGTGTDQNLRSGFTNEAAPISANATLTTTWQRFTYSGTLSASATQVAIDFQFTPTGTAGANDWFEITGIQLEIGTVATRFSRAQGTLQGELAACQRYFQLITGDAEVLGAFYTTTSVVFSYKCPVEMRTTPTVTYSTTFTNAVDQVGVANRTPTAYANSYVAKTGLTFFATGTAASTAYNPAIYRGGNHLVSAEL